MSLDFNLRIVDGLDDTMVVEGGGFYTESPLSMGYANAFYDGTFRWDGILIPLGATVTRAYIEFVAGSDWSSEVNLLFNIAGDAADDSAQLVSYEDYVARSKTAASVEFLFPKVGIGEVFRTPELKAIIQEIVDRPGWSSGSAVNIFFNAPGWPGKEDLIQVRDYDSYPTQAALLHLEYLAATSTTTKPVKTILMDAVEAALKTVTSVKQWKRGQGIPIDQDTAIYPWGCFFDEPVSRKDSNRVVHVTIDLIIHVALKGETRVTFDSMDEMDADIEIVMLTDPTILEWSINRLKPAPADKLYVDEETGLLQVVYQMTYSHKWKDPFDPAK